MSREMQATSNKKFYSVFNGAFRTKVQEGTPGALERINKKGLQVFELETKALFGHIEDIAIEEVEFETGKVKQLKITLDQNEEGKHPILSFGVESKDGRDVIKKLPAIDYEKEVRIMPYRFEGDDGKEVSGVSIFQQDDEGKFTVKVENFFFDPVAKKYLHDFPTIDWDNASESEQKIYKIQRDEFLLNHTVKNILPRFTVKESTKDDFSQYQDDEINPEDIPF